MGHLSARDGYRSLADRLNRFPQGAPPSELLYQILEILFSPREAELVARLPIKPFRTATAARPGACRSPRPASLDGLASRAILLDLERDGEPLYVLPPPMAGFFEFSMMRVRGDVDQKRLAELFYEYLNVEEDFVRELFARGETQLGRTFVQERALPPELSLRVLDYERASAVVRRRDGARGGRLLLPAQDGARRAGPATRQPRDLPDLRQHRRSLAKHGFARAVDAAEGLDLLQQAQERGPRPVRRERPRARRPSSATAAAAAARPCSPPGASASCTPSTPRTTSPSVDDEACDGCGKLRQGLPGGGASASCPDERPGAARPGSAPRRDDGALPRLRRVRRRLHPRRRCAHGGAGGARLHPGQLRPPHRADGDRAGHARRTSSSTTRPTSATARWPRSSA